MLSEDLISFLKDISWTSFGVAFALGIDYFFYLLAGRLLGPEIFGIFGVFMSFYYITARAPFSAIELTSRKIEVDGDSAFEQLAGKTIILGLTVAIVFLIFSQNITNLLDLPIDAFFVFTALFPLVYLNSVITGIFQGRQNFRVYAIYEIVSSTVKFSAILGIIIGLGVTGAVLAPVVEIWSGFGVLYAYLRPKWSFRHFKYGKTLFRSVIYVIAINFAFSLDILLLKYFKPTEVVGLYNSIAVLGKAVFFSSMALSKTAFSKFKSNRDELEILKISLFILGLEGLGFLLFFSLFGDLFLSFTFGQRFVEAARFAPLYILFITLVGAVGLLGNYFLSTNKSKLWVILVMPITEALLIFFFHNTVLQFIKAGITGALISLILLIILGVKQA